MRRRKIIATRFVSCFVLLFATSICAYAQPQQIDRIDVVAKGIYQIEVGTLTPERQTPTGAAASVNNVKNVQDTTTIPGRRGIEFGFQYVIIGKPEGVQVPLRIVSIFPKRGLRNPATRKITYRSEIVRDKTLGSIVYAGYGFEHEWEAVPGTWKFQLWHKNRKLAEQTFTVTKP